MRILPESRVGLIEAAMGKRPFDLVIKNVKMLNCFTGEIYPAEIGIYDGFIAHIKADPDNVKENEEVMEGKEEFDGKGNYIIPGFIDSHIHIESTMMTPRNFAKGVIPHGTTTVITDPHEISNVMGISAVKYMLEDSKDLPMRQYILAPSCVPAVPGVENAGAVFGPEEISELLEEDRVLGLAEVMDFTGVFSCSERMTKIIRETEKKEGFIQGHAPGVSGRALSGYLCGGPQSDHESWLGQEAREKLRLGMNIDARESSLVRNVDAIISSVKDFDFLTNLSFCTDDREPGDILEEGHMNHVVRQAIKAGMKPVQAIRCATFQAAREIGIDNLGAIAPGYVADLVIVPSLTELKADAVFFEGKLVAENNKLVEEIPYKEFPLEKVNSVHVSGLTEDTFKISAPIKEGKVKTRVITYTSQESPITSFEIEELPVKDGYLDIEGIEDLKYVAVINRHKGHDTYSLGVVRNFGNKKGTIASTVSHDCHNLTIVYSTPKEALIAAEEIIKIGGGIVASEKDKLLDKLPLPIGGLMSSLTCEKLAFEISHVKDSLRSLGLSGKNPLLRIATLALPVIPMGKITDMGLVSVLDQKIVPLFAE